MTRPYAADAPSIAERIKQLADERMAVIAGCTCPVDSHIGAPVHSATCPLGPGLPPATPPVAGCACPDDSIAHHATCPVLIAKKPPLGPRPEFASVSDHRRAVADAIAEGSAGR